MALVSDITSTVLSGLNHIDALLDIGPDWNYLTPVGNTILYTFSVSAGNESSQTGQAAFSAAQQVAARAAMKYISDLTGIVFTETSSGTAAQVHLCSIDIAAANTTGLCSWQASYSRQGDQLLSYDASAYVYLDNREWAAANANLAAGTQGYETLLHELGHMLGLKHPFDDAINLPVAQDNTGNTLMSYTDIGGPYATFRQYDIAALNWLYGGDGLGGDLGINSTTGARYITGTNLADTLVGTAFNDVLEGDGGNDLINGGDGTDTAVFSGNFASYKFTEAGGGALIASGADGSDTLTSIEILQFADQSVTRAQAGVDTTPPSVPTAVLANPAGNQPIFSGTAEAGTVIQLINGTQALAQTTASAGGTWSIASKPLANGSYDVTVRSIDQASNASDAAAKLAFSISSSLNKVGTVANDTLVGTSGNNALDGLAGTDTAVYAGARSNYTVSKETLGMSITDKTGTNGVDSLINVERIKFDDVSLGLDIDGVGGRAYRLYQAAFDRQPDLAGLGFWIKSMDAGMTLNQAAADFVGSAEFTALYGNNPTDVSFVTRLYNNVLHRAPEQSGLDYWTNALAVDHLARAVVLSDFSESAENQAQVIGTIQNGFAYTPFA